MRGDDASREEMEPPMAIWVVSWCCCLSSVRLELTRPDPNNQSNIFVI